MELIERYINVCKQVEDFCGYTDLAAQKKVFEKIAAVEPEEKLKVLYEEKVEHLGLKIGLEQMKRKPSGLEIGREIIDHGAKLVATIESKEVDVTSILFVNPVTGNKGAAPVKNVTKFAIHT